jgi:hypothetical protein
MRGCADVLIDVLIDVNDEVMCIDPIKRKKMHSAFKK